MEEIWKDAVGFEDYFGVSNLGNIWSKRTSRQHGKTLLKSGYLVVNTKIGGRGGKCYSLRVHRLVADAFLPKPDDLKEMSKDWVYGKIPVNHKDGNKENNNLENLEWCSYSSNTKHALQNGLLKIKYGKDNPATKLSDEDILYIVNNFKLGDKEFGAQPLGIKFNVARQSIIRALKFYKQRNPGVVTKT